MKRVIVGLKAVNLLGSRPTCIPEGRVRGVKALGVRYEKLFAKALPEAKHGQWLEFWDANGKGYAQPDLLLFLPKKTVVLEVKYSWTAEAEVELDTLYRPLLERLLGVPTQGVVVCKNLTPQVSLPVVRSLDQAVALGRTCCLHWLPGTPVGKLVGFRPTLGRKSPFGALEDL